VLLVLSAPCQLLVLAGPEHGRTIPLGEVARLALTANHAIANETATAFDAALPCGAIFVNAPS